MSIKKILLIAFFNSILFQLFFCKSPSKLTFGINYQNLDAEYCRLFFDANLDDSDQMEHSARLGAVLIKNEIDLDLVNIDVIINQIFLRKKKVLAVPPSIDKSILNAKFKKIKAKIEKKKVGEKFSLVEICKLRIFGMEMKEIRDFLLKVGHKFEEKDLAHLTKLYEKGSNSVECKQLEKVDDFFEKNESEMQIWMFELRNFISQLHSLKLDYLFSNSDDAQKKNFSIWRKFSVRIDGESELSHKLRMLNGRGEIDQIVRIKQKMNRYLMEYKYIGMLELHNPLTMAFDIMGDKMLKTTFRTIVVPADGHQMAAADEITLHNKIWLQISLLCGKIIDYFVQQIHNAKVESANNEVKTDKIENYWKLFARLLGLFKKNSEFDDQKLLLNKFVTLLDYLKGQFGEHKMNLKRKLVLDRLENCFLELYDEDAEFREFLTNDNLPSMAMLKEIFEIAKEKDELISEQFWFFITNNLLEYKESNKSSKEKGEIKNAENNNIINKNNDKMANSTILLCPDENIPLAKLKELDADEEKKDYETFSLMSSYIKLIKNAPKECYSNKINVDVIIWNYKMNIRLLFEFADNLMDKSDKFGVKINEFKNEWQKKKTFGKSEEELCEVHKFAMLLSKNDILSEENLPWREFLAQMLEDDVTETLQNRIVLLPDETEFRWSESDCSNANVHEKVIKALLKNKLTLAQFHFVALNTLLRRFNEIRHFFCYGMDQINNILLKDRIQLALGDKVLDALELAHPELMHFEFLTFSHNYLLFLRQLSHKTGSLSAESAESRIYAPILLNALKFYENNLHNNWAFGREFLKTIQRAKTNFYIKYLLQIQTSKNELIRNAFCFLFRFLESLRKNLMEKTQIMAGKEWHIITECQQEGIVKAAIAEQRRRIRKKTLEFLWKSSAKTSLRMIDPIRAIPGGMTRLWKTLYDSEKTAEQNDDDISALRHLMDSSKMMPDYEDVGLLISHYEEALLSDHDKDRIQGKMKAEFLIFFNWINDQCSTTISFPIMKKIRKYFSKHFQMLNEFYDQIFDESEAEVEQNEHYLVDLIFETKNDVERIMAGQSPNGGTETESAEEWRKRNFHRIIGGKRGQSLEKAKHWEDYLPWMRELHGLTLPNLIKTNEHFAQKLKTACESSLVTRGFLIEILELNALTEILKMLGINHSNAFFVLLEQIGKFEEANKLPSENKITNNKNKPKKKKKVKKSKEEIYEEKEKKEKISENSKKSETNKENENMHYEEEIGERKGILDKKEKLDKKIGEEIDKLNSEENYFQNSDNLESSKNLEIIGAESTSKSVETKAHSKKLDPKEFAGIKLGDFANDNFLALKYGELMAIILREGGHTTEVNSSRMSAFPKLEKVGDENSENYQNCNTGDGADSLARLLDIGALANEIWHYVQTIKALNESKSEAKMEMEWKELKKIELGQQINSENLEENLFWVFKRILGLAEGFAVENLQNSNSEIEYRQSIRHQLHLRKFSMALCHSSGFWENLDKIRRKIILSKVFRIENERMDKLLCEEIDKYLIFNKKLNEQRNLDENLLEEYKNVLSKFVGEKAKTNLLLPYEFAKNWQEINFSQNSIIKLEKVSQIKNHLIANGYLSEDYKIKSQQVISELSNIVEKWSPEALIQFPRFLFEHKKLEPICILPDEFERELIFGKLNCDHSKRENCGDESLYCSLCLHYGVKLIKKVMISAAPPTLEITFMDVPIEMAFIMVPNVKVPNSGKTFGLKTYEKFAKIFEENIESLLRAAHFDEGMKAKAGLRTLSNCLINEKILEILSPVRNFDNKIDDQMEAEFNVTEKLRIVIAYLELWAKSNYIYGKVMGYLDTPMLLIMTAKVFLMFPKASIPFLIEKYFLLYSKWNWPMPVQLTQIDQKRIGEFMSWAPNRERQFESGKELAMAIISPLFPEQNEAMQINLSTAKIIQIELKMAFAQIRKVDNLQALLEPIMVNGRTFTEKYEHFVTFTCGGTELNVETFCHFVGKRLRHELLYFVENSLANWVRFCHVYPTCVPVELSDDQQTRINRPTTFNKMHKKVWLVGLKLRQQKKKNNDAFKNEFKAILGDKLAEINVKIKRDFEGQLFYNVQLNSEYVEEKHQLPKWIQL